MIEPQPVKVGDMVHFGATGPFGCPCVPAAVLHVFSQFSIALVPFGTSPGLGEPVFGGSKFQSAMHGYMLGQWHRREECSN